MNVMPEQKPNQVIIRDSDKEKVVSLPRYGEVKIVCHDGKVKTVERTDQKKVHGESDDKDMLITHSIKEYL